MQKSIRGLQRTGSLSLQYLTNRDPDIQFINTSFRLNSTFAENMLDVVSENLKLKYLKVSKKSSDIPFKVIENESRERWRRIIYYLLNIPRQNLSQTEDEYFKAFHGPLL